MKKRTHTEETKKKISESRKGKALGNKNAAGTPAWNKGLHVRLNPSGEFKKGNKPHNTGSREARVICHCVVCGKEFEEFRSGIEEGRGKYCSRKCYLKSYIPWNKGLLGYNSGEKAGAWKGGITPETRLLRASTEYKLWRTAVFERDNYTCIWCGARSEKGKSVIIEADHIQKWADFPELRFAIDNGRTLCKNCHTLRHKNGGYIYGA